MWTEHIRTEERVGWMTFPRAAAIAELGGPPSARLSATAGRGTRLGLVAARSGARARLDTTFGVIRLDGIAGSPRYEAAPAMGRMRRRAASLAPPPHRDRPRRRDPALEPRDESLRQRHRARPRGRRAARRAARDIPRRHPEPLLDPCRAGRPGTRAKPHRAGRAGSVQLPDRRGREEDHVSAARHPRGRARGPSR